MLHNLTYYRNDTCLCVAGQLHAVWFAVWSWATYAHFICKCLQHMSGAKPSLIASCRAASKAYIASLVLSYTYVFATSFRFESIPPGGSSIIDWPSPYLLKKGTMDSHKFQEPPPRHSQNIYKWPPQRGQTFQTTLWGKRSGPKDQFSKFGSFEAAALYVF